MPPEALRVVKSASRKVLRERVAVPLVAVLSMVLVPLEPGRTVNTLLLVVSSVTPLAIWIFAAAPVAVVSPKRMSLLPAFPLPVKRSVPALTRVSPE